MRATRNPRFVWHYFKDRCCVKWYFPLGDTGSGLSETPGSPVGGKLNGTECYFPRHPSASLPASTGEAPALRSVWGSALWESSRCAGRPRIRSPWGPWSGPAQLSTALPSSPRFGGDAQLGGNAGDRGSPTPPPGPEPEALMLAAPLRWRICGDGDRVPGGRGAAAAGRRALPRGSRRRPDARGAQSPRPSGVGRSPGRRTPPPPRPPHGESKMLGTGCAGTFSSTAESLVRSDATAAPLPTDPLG